MNGNNIFRQNQLDVDCACVVVIDVQEKILPLIPRHEQIVVTCLKMLRGAGVLGLPVLGTEQYPRGLGHTVAPVRDALNSLHAHILEKPTFSAWKQESVRDGLMAFEREQVILIGIETHVCVQQSALDLVSRDFEVFVCADAMGSRGKLDHETALARMRHEGIIVTTVESVLLELCARTDTARFKELLPIIKAFPPRD